MTRELVMQLTPALLQSIDFWPIRTAGTRNRPVHKEAFSSLGQMPNKDQAEHVDDDGDLPLVLEDDDAPLVVESEVYRSLVQRSPAFQWLLSSLHQAAAFNWTSCDAMTTLKSKILDGFPPYHRISRQSPPQTFHFMLELDWNPLMFVNDQQYIENGLEHRVAQAVRHAITLIGNIDDAQALAMESYLLQVWHDTGLYVLDLLSAIDTMGQQRSVIRMLFLWHIRGSSN
jgi:hypothetical protein